MKVQDLLCDYALAVGTIIIGDDESSLSPMHYLNQRLAMKHEIPRIVCDEFLRTFYTQPTVDVLLNFHFKDPEVIAEEEAGRGSILIPCTGPESDLLYMCLETEAKHYKEELAFAESTAHREDIRRHLQRVQEMMYKFIKMDEGFRVIADPDQLFSI